MNLATVSDTYGSLLEEKISSKVLPREDWHIVMLTKVDDLLTVCFASTATTATMAKKARTEYRNGPKFNCDEIEAYLSAVSIII